MSSVEGPKSISDINTYLEGNIHDSNGNKPSLKVDKHGAISYEYSPKKPSSSLSQIINALNSNELLEKTSLDDLKALHKNIRAYCQTSESKKSSKTTEKVYFYTVRKKFSNWSIQRQLDKLDKTLEKWELIKGSIEMFNKARECIPILETAKALDTDPTRRLALEWKIEAINNYKYYNNEKNLFDKPLQTLQEENENLKNLCATSTQFMTDFKDFLTSRDKYKTTFEKNVQEAEKLFTTELHFEHKLITLLDMVYYAAKNSIEQDLKRYYISQVHYHYTGIEYDQPHEVLRKLNVKKRALPIIIYDLNLAIESATKEESYIKRLIINPITEEHSAAHRYNDLLQQCSQVYGYIEGSNASQNDFRNLKQTLDNTFKTLEESKGSPTDKLKILEGIINIDSFKQVQAICDNYTHTKEQRIKNLANEHFNCIF